MNTYPPESLPKGFRYPDRFVKMINSDKKMLLNQWIFIDPISEVGRLLFSLANTEQKCLIPFASLENGDGDVACFDGKDITGNPAVYMLILDDSNRNYFFKDFDDWLNNAATMFGA